MAYEKVTIVSVTGLRSSATPGNDASYHTALWLTHTAHYWHVVSFSWSDLPLFPRQAWIIWGKGNSVSEGIRWPQLSFEHLSPLPVLLHSLVWNDNCSFPRGKAEQCVHKCKRGFEYSSEPIRAFGSHLKWCHTALWAPRFSAACVQHVGIVVAKRQVPVIT